MKRKKIILVTVIGLLIVSFISLYNALDIRYPERGDKDNYFNATLKKIVPQNIKDFVKDNIFVFKKLSILEEKLTSQRKQLQEQINEKNNKITELEHLLLDTIELDQIFEFKKNKKKNEKLHNINLTLKTFSLPILKITGPMSYLSYYNENLFLITGTGILMYSSLENLKDEKFVFKRIDSNFKDIAGKNYINKRRGIVRNLLIKNNKIYVSYEKKVKDNCYTNAILVSNLKFEKIVFDEFFNTNECQPFFDIWQPGGNLSDYKDDKILMTIGDYRSYELQGNTNPQNINSIIGKIISINENTKEYKILSMGHRNSQGLFYDKKNNVIYSTDHGPQGGDEININTSPDGKIKNYGWAISSYGEHYGFPNHISEKYEIAPLNKSHAKYGFIEPLKYFTPSIATTQIIKTEKFIKVQNKNIIYVGAMGHYIEEGDLSIHQFILDADLKIEEHNIIPVHERIRDMVYIEDLNKIFLFLETSGSIGTLELDN